MAVYELIVQTVSGEIHDAFGIAGNKADISNVMKDLLMIRDEVATRVMSLYGMWL